MLWEHIGGASNPALGCGWGLYEREPGEDETSKLGDTQTE